MRAESEERALLEVQHHLGAGIFDCDDQIVFSDADVRIGSFEATVIGSLSSPLGGQMTSSWVNTKSFMHAWEYLRDHGSRFAHFDWTIKVDPDTVLLPGVLRRQLRDFVRPGAVFLNNCGTVETMMQNDGFFGAVEAMSQAAAIAYVENIRRCRDTLDYQGGWGEDLFAQRCMEQAGVRKVDDFELVADGNCRGPRLPDCSSDYPAYHPLKNAADWKQCWSRATHGRSGDSEYQEDRVTRATHRGRSGESEYQEDRVTRATHRGRSGESEYQEDGGWFGGDFDSGARDMYEDMEGGRSGGRGGYGRGDDFDVEGERTGRRETYGRGGGSYYEGGFRGDRFA